MLNSLTPKVAKHFIIQKVSTSFVHKKLIKLQLKKALGHGKTSGVTARLLGSRPDFWGHGKTSGVTARLLGSRQDFWGHGQTSGVKARLPVIAKPIIYLVNLTISIRVNPSE